jgi:hypothetical protein
LSDSLTVGAANLFAEMTTAQISQSVQAKVMRSEFQQAQALVSMLEEQAKAIQSLAYDKNGANTPPSSGSTIDRTV